MDLTTLEAGTFEEFTKDSLACEVAFNSSSTLLENLIKKAVMLYWVSDDAKDARALCTVYDMLARLGLEKHIKGLRDYTTYTCNVALFLKTEAKAIDLYEAEANTDKDIKITQEELLTYFADVQAKGFSKKFFRSQNNEKAGKRSRGEGTKRTTDTSTAASTVGAFGSEVMQAAWVDAANVVAECKDATLQSAAIEAMQAVIAGKSVGIPQLSNEIAQKQLEQFLGDVEKLNALGDTPSSTGKNHTAEHKLGQLTKSVSIKGTEMMAGFGESVKALADVKLAANG